MPVQSQAGTAGRKYIHSTRKSWLLKRNLLTATHAVFSQKELYGKYKANDKPVKIIGITTPVLTDHCRDADSVKKDDLTTTVFDTTTRSDSARILLTNSTGAIRYLTNVTIHGKLIKQFADKNGFIHDNNIDYESIRKNGERKLEIGNNFICLKSQVEKIADYHYKFSRGTKHLYSVTLSGTRHYFEVGEWYTLQINVTTQGINEYMDMLCRCMSVSVERGVDELGTTEVVLEEVEENWTFDSKSVARFMLSGNLNKLPTKEKIIVGASDYDGTADYYCDGTADEVEINKAIVHVKGNYGGGVVELTEGTFITAAAILPLTNIVLQGRGWNSIIEKNGNFQAIYIQGASGSEIENVLLRNFKVQKNDSDTNNMVLIYGTYVRNILLDAIWCHKPKLGGAYLVHCENIIVKNCIFSDSIGNWGLGIFTSPTNPTMAKVNTCMAYGNATSGIYFDGIEYGIIVGCTCRDNSDYGIRFEGVNYSSITGNICKENGSAANEGGIWINNSDHNAIIGNVCKGNNSDGIRIHGATCDRNVVTGNRSTGNTTNNFVDNGTATTDSGNDWN